MGGGESCKLYRVVNLTDGSASGLDSEQLPTSAPLSVWSTACRQGTAPPELFAGVVRPNPKHLPMTQPLILFGDEAGKINTWLQGRSFSL